jgi:hypothetical protein
MNGGVGSPGRHLAIKDDRMDEPAHPGPPRGRPTDSRTGCFRNTR